MLLCFYIHFSFSAFFLFALLTLLVLHRSCQCLCSFDHLIFSNFSCFLVFCLFFSLFYSGLFYFACFDCPRFPNHSPVSLECIIDCQVAHPSIWFFCLHSLNIIFFRRLPANPHHGLANTEHILMLPWQNLGGSFGYSYGA